MPPTPEETRLALMQLSDSALPTGSFSQSMGLETYVVDERVTDSESFARWLHVLIAQQLTFLDALAVRLAMRCTRWTELSDLAAAATLSEEMRRGGQAMGLRLLELASSTLDDARLDAYLDDARAERRVHPAVVWGAIAQVLGVDEETAVAQHLYAVVLSITQNAVRGIPLGQDAGQAVVARARPWVLEATRVSGRLEADDLGVITPGLEIAQMRHKDLRARMFMS